MRFFQNLDNVRKSGELSFSTTPTPLTQIVESSGNTTFTDSTIVDASAWDLSDVSAGEVVVTSDGYIGLIKAVDDGADTLTISYWQDPSGRRGSKGSNIKPADTSTVSVQRVSLSNKLTIKADEGNTDVVYVGRDGTARVTDYPLSPGESIPIEESNGIDVTKTYMLAASGTQTVSWLLATVSDGNYAVNASAAPGVITFTWNTFSDGDATPNVSSSVGHITANTGPTDITDFDGMANGLIVVKAGDALTTIKDNANINLQGGIDFGPMAVGDTITLISQAGTWYETGRSANS